MSYSQESSLFHHLVCQRCIGAVTVISVKGIYERFLCNADAVLTNMLRRNGKSRESHK